MLGHFGRKYCTIIDAVITTFQGNFLSDPPYGQYFFWLPPPLRPVFFFMHPPPNPTSPPFLIKNERSLIHANRSESLLVSLNIILVYTEYYFT